MRLAHLEFVFIDMVPQLPYPLINKVRRTYNDSPSAEIYSFCSLLCVGSPCPSPFRRMHLIEPVAPPNSINASGTQAFSPLAPRHRIFPDGRYSQVHQGRYRSVSRVCSFTFFGGKGVLIFAGQYQSQADECLPNDRSRQRKYGKLA